MAVTTELIVFYEKYLYAKKSITERAQAFS